MLIYNRHNLSSAQRTIPSGHYPGSFLYETWIEAFLSHGCVFDKQDAYNGILDRNVSWLPDVYSLEVVLRVYSLYEGRVPYGGF